MGKGRPGREALTLALPLLALWLYKARDLDLPYFWDELGVYARAAVYLHDHRLSLAPAALPAELSRGHPSLLPFVLAAMFRLFGATRVVAHLFVLVIATSLVSSAYWIARRCWNPPVALMAAVLLMVQPLFLAQSTLVLPEVPLALACLWALYGFYRRQRIVAAIALTGALFLKETALVLDAVLAILLVQQWRQSGRHLRPLVDGAASLLVPNLLFGFFLFVQRRQNGWYLFPEHTRQIDFHAAALMRTLSSALRFLFVEQGRAALSVLLAIALLVSLSSPGRTRLNLRGFGAVLALFVVAVLLFSGGNVFMKRYLLCLLPPVAMAGSRALFDLVRGQRRGLVLGTVALSAVAIAAAKSPAFNCEFDMSFRESVRLQQQATRYLAETVGTDKSILANFPTIVGLEDPRWGYAPARFERFAYGYSPEADYIFASELFAPFTPPHGVQTRLVRRFSSPYMTIALYRIVR